MKSPLDVLRRFATLLDLRLGVILALSVATTAACYAANVTAELPSSLIGIAVVFPIVFSINAAYRRREQALEAVAAVKGNTTALLFASRDWVSEASPELVAMSERAVRGLLRAIRGFLHESPRDAVSRRPVYDAFSELSGFVEALRRAGVPSPEVSRASDSMRMLFVSFESLANIATYRTPVTLRAYSKVFLNAFPLLFAPQFAHIGRADGLAIGIGLAAVYSVVLVSLDSVQDRLEDPFDLDGVDDVDLELEAQHGAAFDAVRA